MPLQSGNKHVVVRTVLLGFHSLLQGRTSMDSTKTIQFLITASKPAFLRINTYAALPLPALLSLHMLATILAVITFRLKVIIRCVRKQHCSFNCVRRLGRRLPEYYGCNSPDLWPVSVCVLLLFGRCVMRQRCPPEKFPLCKRMTE